MKEFWKSVKNWQSYRHEFGVLLFGTVYYTVLLAACLVCHCNELRLLTWFFIFSYSRLATFLHPVTLTDESALLMTEGWWFVHVQDTDEQGWAPASCLLPENRDQLVEVAVTGNTLYYSTIRFSVSINCDKLFIRNVCNAGFAVYSVLLTVWSALLLLIMHWSHFAGYSQ